MAHIKMHQPKKIVLISEIETQQIWALLMDSSIALCWRRYMSHELRLEIVVIPIIVITIIVRWSQILNLKISDVDRLT